MAIVDLNGKTLKGRPSSELKMHLKVYERCKEAKAVIHAHPPISIAWTIAQPELKELAFGCISELILACGSIPIVPFAFPGTEEMADHLIPFLNDSRTMILARHGVLSWGESLEEAHRGVERIEHAAQVLYYAKNLGGLTELSSKDIEKLREMRKKIGNITL
jgi:L-fuculose-phosphate aldolase